MLGALCLLVGVAVLDCSPAAAQYEDAARLIPARHWALVRDVGIDPYNRGAARPLVGLIVLPAHPHLTGPEWIVAHEVGHLVVRRPDLWTRWFHAWGHLPCTAYAARFTDPAVRADEGFAEAYAELVTGRTVGCAEQAAWIRGAA
jgi:hypothetical protein